MSHTDRPTVVIFGSSDPQPDDPEYRQAYELGKTLSQAGYALANGGYDGTMAAAARAARDHDGFTTGVTCHAFKRAAPNPWIDREIQTESLSQRLDTLIHAGHAYVALPGSTGTLLEIAMAWELINKRMIPERPIILLSDYWKPVIDTLTTRGRAQGHFIHFAQTVPQLVHTIQKHLVV